MTAKIRPDHSDADFVAMLPKVELHVHVEGTIEPETLFNIADRNSIELPYDTPQGMLSYQTENKSEGTENLANFLECLDISRSALRTASDYHAITVNFLRRCRDEGVRYVEMMFDPQQAIRQGVPFSECLDALAQGRNDGLRDHGVRSQWILCFQRDHPATEAAPLLDAAMAHSTEIAGVGLDNYETPGFPRLFQSAFDQARIAGLRLTSHCDVNQSDSVQHIKACIEHLGVERIDHGLNTVDDPALLELVLDREVALTGCPTFYAGQTACPADRLEMHRSLADAGVCISLNTDDPAQFGSGWLTNTMLSAMQAAPFTRAEIVRFAQNAIDTAWTDATHKRELTVELDSFCNASD